MAGKLLAGKRLEKQIISAKRDSTEIWMNFWHIVKCVHKFNYSYDKDGKNMKIY